MTRIYGATYEIERASCRFRIVFPRWRLCVAVSLVAVLRHEALEERLCRWIAAGADVRRVA